MNAKITFIGGGNMATSLIGGLLANQYPADLITVAEPDESKCQQLQNQFHINSTVNNNEAVASADVVVLAVPGMVTATVAKGLGDLTGKIIIDATNPLERASDGPVLEFRHGVASSNGEIVQALHPGAFVVKAFNTIPWQKMIDPGKPRPVMPLAGNSAEAKQKVAEWVQAMGIDTIDTGGIVYAGVTERLIVMTLNNQFSDDPKFDVVFRKRD